MASNDNSRVRRSRQRTAKPAGGKSSAASGSRYTFIRETHTTNGRRRKSWTLVPGLKAWVWVLLFTLSGVEGLSIAFAADRLSQTEIQAMSAMADDGQYDLRDENNQPVKAERQAAVKEELRQGSAEYQYRALFRGDLPRTAQIQGLMEGLKSFLKVALTSLPLLMFDIIAPPQKGARPIAAGVFSSLAPALFACAAILRILTVEQCRRAPAVLRC